MEQWKDQGIVLSVRKHGESGAIVSLLTEEHGRHAGYVRGATSSRMRGMLEPGTLVGAEWQARIADNLGSFVLEQEKQIAYMLMDDPLRLAALLSACQLCDEVLPEREVHPGIFHGLLALFDAINSDDWSAVYVMWEVALLRELGFSLDLSRCVAGGNSSDLIYVSPKSGGAVSREAGELYKEKLLPLPLFLQPVKGPATEYEILNGLKMTGYFLEHWVFAHHNRGVPENRLRFLSLYEREYMEESNKIAS
jgi:DNA repair protein RecO (recombination protein O)